MQLKKILPALQTALIEKGFTEPTMVQEEAFSVLKSGVSAILGAPKGTGKTTLMLMSIIQKLQAPVGESTRALLMVPTKQQLLAIEERWNDLAGKSGLRAIFVHEKTDLDEEKNTISAGMDLIVGTPAKINALFSGAGFNINTVRIIGLDDAEEICQLRQEPYILRLLASITKTQWVVMADSINEKVENLAIKLEEEPLFLEWDEEDFEEQDEEQTIESDEEFDAADELTDDSEE